METVQRPSLGQVATLGMLYDGHNDSFLPVSLIPGPLPDSAKAVKVTQKPGNTFAYSASDTYKEKFTKLGFNKALQASFLGGLIKAEGSASYAAEGRDSDSTTEASLYHKVLTVSEKLELAAPGLLEHLDFSVLEDSPATHLVTEIIWGASTVITARHSKRDDVPQAVEASAEALRVELMALKAAVEGSPTNTDLGRNTAQGPSHFQFKVFSDVKADDGRSPTTFEEARDFLSNVPSYVKQSNRGKGKQLTYRLVPLTILGDIFSDEVESFPEISLSSPGTETITKCVTFFDELRSVQRALSAYRLRTKPHRHCIPEQYIQDIQDLKSQLSAHEPIVTSEFGATVQAIRNGQSAEDLGRLLAKFQTSPLSPKAVLKTVSEYSAKMDFADTVIAKGAIYIGFINQDIPIEGETYTFRFNWNTQSQEPSFKENEDLLFELLDGMGVGVDGAKIVVRDCDGITDAEGNPETVGKPIISRQTGKDVLTLDMVEERKELVGKGFMEPEAATFEAIVQKEQTRPPKVAKVNVPCPGPNCASNGLPDWICSKCRSTVVFGFDDLYLYCDCGRAKYQTWSFRCTAGTHGSTFVKYDDVKLCELLSKLPPMDELNILILGVTGVGKSTFINAFVNYLGFDSLDDAIRTKPLSWLIPFAFSTQAAGPGGKFIETIVEAEIPSNKTVPSSAKNEKLGVTGQSATQQTMVHSVQMGNTIVRLFDTPGIGDTRGMDVDKSNMADILATLTNYDKLHGIVILLKPNNPRLDALFTFCLGELLTHLHRDATRNLVFGFTNTRGSNYQPGDTFGPLQECLKKFNESQGSNLGLFRDNVYCFDSESFRYLAAYHRGIDMGHRNDYVQSWETSTKESQRLIEYFKTRQPHMIKDTTNLNDTRHMLTTLTGPMSEIMGKIAETVASVEKEIKLVDSGKIAKLDLEGKLHTKIATLTATPLARPRTVCAHTSCVDYKPDENNIPRAVYRNKCHDPCWLTDVPVEKRAPPGLIDCSAFTNGTCDISSCRHSWQDHMHVLVELTPAWTTVENPNTRAALTEATSELERKAIIIADKEKTLIALKSEHAKIEKAAVQFCLFLKRNSITPYNDGMLDYLDQLIEGQKGCVAATEDNTPDRVEAQSKLASLEVYKAKYKALKEVMGTKVEGGDNPAVLTNEEVHAKVGELYNLTIYGPVLRQLTATMTKAHKATHREYSHKVNVKSKQWSVMNSIKGLFGR